MRTSRLPMAIAAAALLAACEGLTVDVGVDLPPHFPPPQEPHGGPPAHDPYPDLPRRASYCAMNDVDLFEGVYVGDFVLGRSQIEVRGAGADCTIIDGDLILQTQCTVSNLTVLGDVIFEGHQAELVDVDFYGRIIDKGSQNRY